VLVDVGSVTTATSVLGHEVSMPVLASPIAHQRMAHPDGELAVARAAATAETIMCVPTFAMATPAEIAAEAPQAPRWYQLYWHPDREVTRSILDQAREAGCSAIVFTVDLPKLGRRERDLRTGFTLDSDYRMGVYGSELGDLGTLTPATAAQLVDPRLTWRDLEWLHETAELPVIVKGVLTAEDAELAVSHGCAAVIVSNHGGRQLDRAVASLDALPEVVEAVGERAEVLMDGGVRRGADVAIALALGARAVCVGRPVVWGLAANGEEGVRHVFELLRAELELALALLGCASPENLGRGHVVRAAS
jgi:isopentenyl diphosphate isomerase/L-lactate dehydrogenase-like FMN-dependent dehydrogenase